MKTSTSIPVVHTDVFNSDFNQSSSTKLEELCGRVLLHNNLDAVIVMDQHLEILGCNAACAGFYEIDTTKIKGKHLSALLSLKIHPEAHTEIFHELQMRKFWQGGIVLKNHYGNPQLFQGSIIASTDANAHVIGYVFRTVMITNVGQTNPWYRTVFHGMYQFMILLNPKGYVIDIAETVLHFTGAKKEAVMGKLLWQTLGWKHAETSQIKMREAIDKAALGTFVRFELEMIGKESASRIIDFSFKPQKNEVGDVIMLICEGRDISELKKVEEELAITAERYQYANQATSDAIFEWNILSGRIFRGPGYEHIFDSEFELLKDYYDQIHPGDRNRIKLTVAKAFKNESIEKCQFEFRYTAENGYKNISSRLLIIRKNGSPVRVIGSLRDITTERQLQFQILQEKDEKKRAIIKSIIETQEKERRKLSVELHDNVNQILASCKLLLDGANESLENAELLNRKVYEGIGHAIDEIRKISHELNPCTLDDLGLVEAINALVETINLSGKLHISFFPDHVSYVDILRKEDKIAIYRIIQEQVSNIVKHADANQVTIILGTADNIVSISITDDGKGCDEKIQKNGLGLKSIQNRIDYYNGSMETKSQPGKGFAMKIILHLNAKV